MGILPKRALRANPNHRDEQGLRRPSPRGDLAKALADESALSVVAPETPRPEEMLEHVTVHGDDRLTADDLALHELLVAHAYETSDRTMSAAEYSIPVTHVLTFLGEHARRASIKKSLERLRSTTVTYGSKATKRIYENVPMLTPWTERSMDRDVGDLDEELHYEIPRPIRALMASQARYAYLELGPLAKMSSRYGIRLYRHLSAAMALKTWDAGTDNLHEVDVDVATMAKWLGYGEPDKPLHVGHMRTRAVDPAIRDLEHVRRFSLVDVAVRRAAKKGAPVEAWTFTLRLNAPPQHHTRKIGVSEAIFPHVGGVDDPRFRINQAFWLRAAGFAREHQVAQSPLEIFPVWLIAVREALNGDAVTVGYSTRRFRGQRLLDAIDERGPENTAWDWLVEEVTSPDLLGPDFRRQREFYRLQREAQRARYHRYQDHVQGSERKRRAKDAASARAPAPAPLIEPRIEIAPVAAEAPVTEIVFWCDLDADTTDVETLVNLLARRTFAGDEDALVQVTVKYCEGLGYVPYSAGMLPMTEMDVSRLKAEFRTIIENVEIVR